MRRLKLAIPAIATGLLLGASPAEAQHPFTPATFQNAANVFDAADLDRNRSLSSWEYVLLRTGTIDRAWIRNHPGHTFNQVLPAVAEGFARIDTDNNAVISRREFVNSARLAATAGNARKGYDSWDWRPEYMSATYYLLANRIDADSFNGRRVTNLDGQELGTIRDVMRHQETGEYYALVGMTAKVMDPTPTQFRGRLIGVPLDDVIFASNGTSLMLTERGERYYLRDPDLPRVNIEQLEQVDSLTAV